MRISYTRTENENFAMITVIQDLFLVSRREHTVYGSLLTCQIPQNDILAKHEILERSDDVY